MWVIVASVTLNCVLAAVFACSRYKGRERASFALKVAASASFLLTAILSVIFGAPDAVFAAYMLVALSLGFLGDVALGSRTVIPQYKKYVMSLGIVIFLAGHVVFSICYLTFAAVEWWIYLVNIVPALLIMSMTYVLKYKLSTAYKVIGFFYSYTISLMLVGAIAFFQTSARVGGTLILLGGIFFYISDCLLSISYFKLKVANYKILNLIVHITYYLAQILLALSLFFV